MLRDESVLFDEDHAVIDPVLIAEHEDYAEDPVVVDEVAGSSPYLEVPQVVGVGLEGGKVDEAEDDDGDECADEEGEDKPVDE